MVVQPEGMKVTLDADLVVLAAGIEPNKDNDVLAKMLKVPLSEDGFYLEAHAKLRPLDFAADGVYLAGLAHSPRFIEETMAQANGAAIRAVTLLSRKQLQSAAIIAALVVSAYFWWWKPIVLASIRMALEGTLARSSPAVTYGALDLAGLDTIVVRNLCERIQHKDRDFLGQSTLAIERARLLQDVRERNDALAALQHVSCNDASRLRVGEIQHSGLMTAQGTFVDDLRVYRFAARHFLLIVNAATPTATSRTSSSSSRTGESS
jgi:hypothetical protein